METQDRTYFIMLVAGRPRSVCAECREEIREFEKTGKMPNSNTEPHKGRMIAGEDK
jgi:hypothetical protein